MIDDFVTYSLNMHGRLVKIERPWVMGIVNVTTDSFHAASRAESEDAVTRIVGEMTAQGVDVIDVGACSTRPGATLVSEEEECARLETGLIALRKVAPRHIVSVDTFRASVARRAVEEWGADIINDVSGATFDPDMGRVAASLQVPLVVMHNQGVPAATEAAAPYNDVSAQVLEWLARRVDDLRQQGVCDVIVDPGFGFGKSIDDNFSLLAHLQVFHSLQCPLLVGMSRKSMVCRTLDCAPADALNGTTVLTTLALQAGAHIIRVHDVEPAVQARTLVARYHGKEQRISNL